MSVCVDSGVIAKLYVLEPDSPEAVRLVSSYAPPLALRTSKRSKCAKRCG